MSVKILTIDNFFNLQQTAHQLLFDGEAKNLPWLVVARLADYVKKQIKHKKIAGTAVIHKTAIIGDHVQIGERTVIGPYAVIEEGVVIGDDCRLGMGCYIRSASVIGNHCVIGHCSEIKQSLLFNEVGVPHFNYIGDSVVGFNVHFGGGAMVANFKSDGSNVSINIGRQRFATGLRKFGAIIGDLSEIGAGAILNPGTCLGRNVSIYPGSIIRGYVPADTIYKTKTTAIELTPRQ